MSPILRLTAIHRAFGSFRALTNASLDVEAGRILALVGENGAGKTTLMRIASGELAADSGEVKRESPSTKIELVHQHFMLVPHFSIAENLALADGSAPASLPPSRISAIARSASTATPFDLGNLDRLVVDLSAGEKSRVELVKALSRRPDVLILDEPTSVLAPAEVDRLGESLRMLAAAGTAIVIITHKLAEVFAIADDVVVLRRGEVVHRSRVEDTTPDHIATAMIGEAPPGNDIEALRPSTGEVLLTIAGLSTRNIEGGTSLREVQLTVSRGEIVAITGVAGNGQRELARVLRGIEPPTAGTISFRQSPIDFRWLQRTHAIGHIPPDRTSEGIVAGLSIADNMVVGRGASGAAAITAAEEAISRFQIAARSPRQMAGSLSGGNQQKVILARELGRLPDLIVATDPTRGLDIGASAFVHDELRRAAASGAATLLITSDLDEALALASRIHVLYRGSLSGAVEGSDRQATLARLMGGVD